MSNTSKRRKSIRWIDHAVSKFLFNIQVSAIHIPSNREINTGTTFSVIFEAGGSRASSKDVLPVQITTGDWVVNINETLVMETSFNRDPEGVYHENIGKLIVRACEGKESGTSGNSDDILDYTGSTSLKLHSLATAAGSKAIEKQFSLPLKKFKIEGAVLNVIVTAQYTEEVAVDVHSIGLTVDTSNSGYSYLTTSPRPHSDSNNKSSNNSNDDSDGNRDLDHNHDVDVDMIGDIDLERIIEELTTSHMEISALSTRAEHAELQLQQVMSSLQQTEAELVLEKTKVEGLETALSQANEQSALHLQNNTLLQDKVLELQTELQESEKKIAAYQSQLQLQNQQELNGNMSVLSSSQAGRGRGAGVVVGGRTSTRGGGRQGPAAVFETPKGKPSSTSTTTATTTTTSTVTSANTVTITQLQSQLDEKEKAISDLKYELEMAMNSSSDLSKQLEKEKFNFKQNSTALDETRTALRAADSRIASISIQLMAKDEVVHSMKTELSSITTRLNESENNRQSILVSRGMLEESNKVYQKKVEEMNETIALLQEKLTNTVQELERQQKHVIKGSTSTTTVVVHSKTDAPSTPRGTGSSTSNTSTSTSKLRRDSKTGTTAASTSVMSESPHKSPLTPRSARDKDTSDSKGSKKTFPVIQSENFNRNFKDVADVDGSTLSPLPLAPPGSVPSATAVATTTVTTTSAIAVPPDLHRHGSHDRDQVIFDLKSEIMVMHREMEAHKTALDKKSLELLRLEMSSEENKLSRIALEALCNTLNKQVLELQQRCKELSQQGTSSGPGPVSSSSPPVTENKTTTTTSTSSTTTSPSSTTSASVDLEKSLTEEIAKNTRLLNDYNDLSERLEQAIDTETSIKLEMERVSKELSDRIQEYEEQISLMKLEMKQLTSTLSITTQLLDEERDKSVQKDSLLNSSDIALDSASSTVTNLTQQLLSKEEELKTMILTIDLKDLEIHSLEAKSKDLETVHQRNCMELEKNIAQLEKDTRESSTTVHSLQEKLSISIEIEKGMKVANQEQEGLIQSLRAEIEAVELTIRETTTLLENERMKSESIESSVDANKNGLMIAVSEKNRLSLELWERCEEIKLLSSKISTYEESITNMKETSALYTIQMEEMKISLVEANAKVESLSIQISDRDVQLSSLQSQLELSASRVVEIEGLYAITRSDMKELQCRYNQQATDNQSLLTRLLQSVEKETNVQAMLESLQNSSVSDKESYEKTVNDLKQEVESTASVAAKMSQELEEEKDKVRQITDACHKLTSLVHITSLQDDNASDTVSSFDNVVTAISEKLAHSENQLHMLKSEIDHIAIRLEESENTCLLNRQELDTTLMEKEALEMQIQQQQQEILNLSEKASVETQCEEFQHEKELLVQRTIDLETELMEVRRNNDSLVHSLHIVSTSESEARIALETLIQKTSSFSEAGATTTTITTASEPEDEVQVQVQAGVDDNDHNAAITNGNNKNDDLIANMTAELATKSKELQAEWDRSELLLKTLDSTKNSLTLAEAETDELSMQLALKDSDIESLGIELNMSKKRVVEAENAMAKLMLSRDIMDKERKTLVLRIQELEILVTKSNNNSNLQETISHQGSRSRSVSASDDADHLFEEEVLFHRIDCDGSIASSTVMKVMSDDSFSTPVYALGPSNHHGEAGSRMELEVALVVERLVHEVVVVDMGSELTSIKGQLSAQQLEHEKSCREENKLRNKVVSELQLELNSLNEINTNLSKQLQTAIDTETAVRTEMERVSKELSDRIQEYEEQISLMKLEMQQLTSTLSITAQLLDEERDKSSDIALETAMSKVAILTESLTNRDEELKAMACSVDLTEAEMDSLQQQFKALESELNIALQNESSLRSRLYELETVAGTSTDIDTETDTVIVTGGEDRCCEGSIKEEIADISEAVTNDKDNDKDNLIARMTLDLHKVSADYVTATNLLESCNKELEVARVTVATLEQQLITMKTEVSDLNSAVTLKDSEYKRLQDIHTEDNVQKDVRILELEKGLLASSMSIQSLTQRLSKAEEAETEAKDAVEELRKGMVSQLEDKDRSLQELQSQLAVVQATESMKANDLEQEKIRFEKNEIQMEEMKISLVEANAKVESLSIQISDRDVQLSSLQSQLELSASRVVEIEGLYAIKRSEMEELQCQYSQQATDNQSLLTRLLQSVEKETNVQTMLESLQNSSVSYKDSYEKTVNDLRQELQSASLATIEVKRELEGEKDKLKHMSVALESANNALLLAVSQTNSLSIDVAEKDEEMEKLKSQLSTLQSHLTEVSSIKEERLLQATASVTALSAIVDANHHEINEIKKNIPLIADQITVILSNNNSGQGGHGQILVLLEKLKSLSVSSLSSSSLSNTQIKDIDTDTTNQQLISSLKTSLSNFEKLLLQKEDNSSSIELKSQLHLMLQLIHEISYSMARMSVPNVSNDDSTFYELVVENASLLKRVSDQDRIIRDLSGRVTDGSLEMQDSSNIYQDQINELRTTNKSLQERINVLSVQLEDAEKNESRLLEDNELLDRERWSAMVAETAAQAEITYLKKEQQSKSLIEQQCDEQERQIGDMKALLGIISSELDDSRRLDETRDVQWIQLTEENDRLQKDLDCSLTSLNVSKVTIAELQQTLFEQNDETMREIEERDRSLQLGKKRIVDLEGMNAALIKEIVSKEEEFGSARQLTDAQIAILERQIKDLKEMLDIGTAAANTTKSNENIYSANSSYNIDKNSSSNFSNILINSSHESLQQDKWALHGKIEALESKLSDLEVGSQDALLQERNKVQVAECKFQELASQLDSKIVELEEIKTTLLSTETENKSLAKRLFQIRQELELTSLHLVETEASCSEHISHREEIERERRTLKLRNEELEVMNKWTESNLISTRLQLQTAQRERETLDVSLQSANKQIEYLDGKIRQLSESLLSSQDTSQEKESSVDVLALETQLLHMTESLQVMTTTKDELSAQLSVVLADNTILASQILSLEENISTMTRQKEIEQETVQDISATDKQEILDMNMKMAMEINARTDAETHMKELIYSLETQLATALQSNKRLSEDLSDLQRIQYEFSTLQSHSNALATKLQSAAEEISRLTIVNTDLVNIVQEHTAQQQQQRDVSSVEYNESGVDTVHRLSFKQEMAQIQHESKSQLLLKDEVIEDLRSKLYSSSGVDMWHQIDYLKAELDTTRKALQQQNGSSLSSPSSKKIDLNDESTLHEGRGIQY